MPTARLRERIASAQPVGPAQLPGFDLRIDKRGRDGTPKANLARAPGGVVWGVVYRLAADEWAALDGFEAGYRRFEVAVIREGGSEVAAQTYISERRIVNAAPHRWYRALLLEGAREHNLPDSWIARLERIPLAPLESDSSRPI